ncbi:MAG: 2-amino-4-hydroxy-6-hydroxymethyldihydropteridine diphosphokinase [Candidatus Omnitrophica bacterium]|nr:2-amino-4-hydroxy-6-hydroxymethyldihydropteridine diphosphokinase [Candidatus Omnitrophota bacterium]MCM8777270.1 2-amino-4-hydroxy-6-hydroxymethyldihydropteridine diphosphokinase [Candidatus Omnitrophota bacterium]
MVKAYIAIGSNKGNREHNVIKALKKMEKGLTIKKISPFFTTPPEEGANGGFFINSVIEVETKFSPENLLLFLQNIEKSMGRKFPHKTGDERTIDLDIIFYGNIVIKTGNFFVPHPKYSKRYFVVFPLYEIAPLIKDPETGESISVIYRRLISNEDSKESR